MFFCSECLENKATWLSEEFYCDDCVSRGCSCNDDYFYTTTYKDLKDEKKYQEFTYKENIIKFLSENDINEYKVLYSTKGVELNNEDSYILHLEKTEYRELSAKELSNTDFINKITLNKNSCIKIVPIDEFKREYPCCEVLDLRSLNEEPGEIFYSIKNKTNLILSDIYDNGHMRLHPFLNFKDKQIDFSNPIYFGSNGIKYDEEEIDILLEDKEEIVNFKLLNMFIFNTDNNIIFTNFEKEINKSNDKKNINKILKNFNEFNDDISYYFSMYNLDSNNKRMNEVKLLLKNIIIQHLKDNINTELNKNDTIEVYLNDLFNDLIKFHEHNEVIKYSDVFDSSIHIGCDCGCGGDYIDEGYMGYIDDLLNKRKNNFKSIYKKMILRIYY